MFQSQIAFDCRYRALVGLARRPVFPYLVSYNAHSLNIFVLIYWGRNSIQLKPKKADKIAEFFIRNGLFGLTEDPDVSGVLTVDGTGRDVDDVAMRDCILALVNRTVLVC